MRNIRVDSYAERWGEKETVIGIKKRFKQHCLSSMVPVTLTLRKLRALGSHSSIQYHCQK